MAINLKFLQDSLETNKVETTSTDVLPSTRRVLPSNIYSATVVDAFFITSSGGAQGITITLKIDGEDTEYNETIYFTSKKTKAPFYLDDKGNKKVLPGWIMVNDFAKLTVGEELGNCVTIEKQAKVWENGQQVTRVVDALDNCVNSQILVAIQQVEQNRYANHALTNEKITVNVISKFLCASDKRTISEISNNKPAEFYEKWLEANKDKVINKYKPIAEDASISSDTSAKKEVSAADLFTNAAF